MKNPNIYKSGNSRSVVRSKGLNFYGLSLLCGILLSPILSYAITLDDMRDATFEYEGGIRKDIPNGDYECTKTCELEAGICHLKGSSNVAVEEKLNSVTIYRVDVNITWNSESPAWPDEAAHFSWIGGGTHNSNVKFWEVGTLASPGMDLLSVTGRNDDLVSEIFKQKAIGNAENVIDIRHWFCPDSITHNSCGDRSFELEVSEEFPLVTLASMLGPSPDWFIGVESLSMVDEDGEFIPEIIFELYPYDAGILSDNSVLIGDCCGREPLSDPQENIHLITEESGETIGPGSLGQIIFTEISPMTTSVASELLNSVVDIYPNPVSETLHIETESTLDFQIAIFDLKGALLYRESNKSSIDVTQFPHGAYLLEITDRKTRNKFIEKIIVEK